LEYFDTLPFYNKKVKVENIAMKGRFLIALEDFQMGDIIFEENPFLFGDIYKMLSQLQSIKRNPNPPIDASVFFELHAHPQSAKLTLRQHLAVMNRFSDLKDDISQILDIVETNGMQGDDGTSIYLLGSMINHSCKPNAQFHTWKNRFYLCALMPIQAGYI
jgi:hypothetical protein